MGLPVSMTRLNAGCGIRARLSSHTRLSTHVELTTPERVVRISEGQSPDLDLSLPVSPKSRGGGLFLNGVNEANGVGGEEPTVPQ